MRKALLYLFLFSCVISFSLSLRARFYKSNYAFENSLLSSESEDESLFQNLTAQYKFDNPEVALKLLEIFTKEKPHKSVQDYYKHQLKRDPNYCLRAMEAFVKKPEFVFNDVSFVSDYIPHAFFRETIIPMIGHDAMPYAYNSEEAGFLHLKPPFDIDPYITDIFTKGSRQQEYQLGVYLGCITQNFNHIYGCAQFADKDLVALNLKMYQRKYKWQPACSPGDSFFPETWILWDKSDCENWFDYINSPEYEAEKAQKNIVFIRKIGKGMHRGKGVHPVDSEEEAILRSEYNNGELCGKNEVNMIVQRYVSNPLLVQGHKFDFRVYMMISSTDPLTVYYHDGFLRVSLYEYDVNSHVKGVHLTNTAQSEGVFKDKKIQEMMGMNETELRNFQMWNYTRLAQYLLDHGQIESMVWIDEYLRPKIEHAMQHLVRMAQSGLTKVECMGALQSRLYVG